MSRLELELNTEKTRIVNLWEGKDSFVFLGFKNRKVKMKSINGRIYYAFEQRICIEKQKVIKEKVKETLKDATLYQDIEVVIKRLNLKIVGWRNYYGLSPRVRIDEEVLAEVFAKARTLLYNCSERIN